MALVTQSQDPTLTISPNFRQLPPNFSGGKKRKRREGEKRTQIYITLTIIHKRGMKARKIEINPSLLAM